jgi:hypothetical protein
MASDNANNFFVNLEWNDASEKLVAEWADIAACYVWIFDKGYRRFNKLNYKFSIPIIVLSTVTGTLSMSLNTILPADYVTTGQVAIGGVNIFTGIITTLQNFFKYAQQSETHLHSSIEWAKFERNIKIELSIERYNRKPAPEFIKLARHDYEKLLSNNPIIPLEIIEEFRRTVKDLKISKPVLIKTLEATKIYSEFPTEENISPNKVSYLKRFASLIPGTKSFKQATGQTPLGKLELLNTNSSNFTNSPNQSQLTKSDIYITPNINENNILLSSSDRAIKEIALNSLRNTPSKQQPSPALSKILNDIKNDSDVRIVLDDISDDEVKEEKITVSTPRNVYELHDDIIIEPKIHPTV